MWQLYACLSDHNYNEFNNILDFLQRAMLVILTEEQILSPQQICQGCLLADRRGYPRWNQGKLGCGHECHPEGSSASKEALPAAPSERCPPLYECQMGFLIANVESP